MATNTLTQIGTGAPVEATGDLVDQYLTALGGDFVPRNSSGVPTTIGGGLGSATYKWASCYIDNLLLDGNTFSSTSGAINITPFAGSAIVLDTNMTIDGGVVSITGDLSIDNININGNTIISTDTNGDINLTANGSGQVIATDLKVNTTAQIFGTLDQAKTYNTNYQAATDLFITAYALFSGASSSIQFTARTDSGSSPSTIVVNHRGDAHSHNDQGSITISFVVKKDDYWKIERALGNSPTISSDDISVTPLGI